MTIKLTIVTPADGMPDQIEINGILYVRESDTRHMAVRPDGPPPVPALRAANVSRRAALRRVAEPANVAVNRQDE